MGQAGTMTGISRVRRVFGRDWGAGSIHGGIREPSRVHGRDWVGSARGLGGLMGSVGRFGRASRVCRGVRVVGGVQEGLWDLGVSHGLWVGLEGWGDSLPFPENLFLLPDLYLQMNSPSHNESLPPSSA